MLFDKWLFNYIKKLIFGNVFESQNRTLFGDHVHKEYDNQEVKNWSTLNWKSITVLTVDKNEPYVLQYKGASATKRREKKAIADISEITKGLKPAYIDSIYRQLYAVL